MRPLARAALAATLVLCALAAVAAGEERALVLRAVDGDTLEVALASRTEKVRLIGVNTPESVHPGRPVERFGKESSAFLRRLVEGRRVVLRDDPEARDRDRYGRLLRYVFLEDGTLVNAEIIRQGFGHAYVKYPFGRMEEFRDLERRARERGVGLWGPAPAEGRPAAAAGPPAGSGAAVAGSRAASETAAAGARASPEAGAARYVASARGGRYHRPDCGRARAIRPANLIRFDTPEGARRAGYTPCSVCRPPIASRASRGGSRAP
jgi:micrococcal nuclease